MKRAIFLDRDGVINKKAKEHDYIKNWGEFEFLSHVANVISQLNKNFLVIVVSNQQGVSRGLVTLDDVNTIHANMQLELKKSNATIDKIYVCPHGVKERCACRKPKPGLLLQAARELNIDLLNSYMIGDSPTDIEAGKKAGCKTILIASDKVALATKPHFTARSMSDILHFVN